MPFPSSEFLMKTHTMYSANGFPFLCLFPDPSYNPSHLASLLCLYFIIWKTEKPKEKKMETAQAYHTERHKKKETQAEVSE